MAIRRARWVAWGRRAGVFLVALALSACVSSSTPPPGLPLRILDAAISADPDSYSQPCGAAQTFRYTATLTANDRNTGGKVHYRWHIGFSTVEGDITFSPGDMTRELSQTVTAEVQPDAAPLLVATLETTAPNVTSSPRIEIRLSCSAAFQVLSADVMVSPSSIGCGSQTAGFAAVLAATEGNPGGDARYTWHFLDGSTQSGHVTFAPGQITATLAVALTYFVAAGQQTGALSPSGADTAARPTPTPIRFPTPRPTATRPPRPTPTPKVTPTPRPTPSPTPGPPGTPTAGGQIGAWLTVDTPNSLQSDTVTAAIVC